MLDHWGDEPGSCFNRNSLFNAWYHEENEDKRQLAAIMVRDVMELRLKELKLDLKNTEYKQKKMEWYKSYVKILESICPLVADYYKKHVDNDTRKMVLMDCCLDFQASPFKKSYLHDVKSKAAKLISEEKSLFC
jgi:hypothetical protein